MSAEKKEINSTLEDLAADAIKPLPPLIRHGEDRDAKIKEFARSWLQPIGKSYLTSYTGYVNGKNIPSIEHVRFYDENTDQPIDLTDVLNEIDDYVESLPEYKGKHTCDDQLLLLRDCLIPRFAQGLTQLRPRIRFENCEFGRFDGFSSAKLNSVEIVNCRNTSVGDPSCHIDRARVQGSFYMHSCTWSSGINCDETIFEKQFEIGHCSFSGDGVSFAETCFLNGASFWKARLGQMATFTATQFKDYVHFTDCEFDRGARFEFIRFPDAGWFDRGRLGLGGEFRFCYFPATFEVGSIDLRHTHFLRCTIHRPLAKHTIWPQRHPPDTLRLRWWGLRWISSRLQQYLWDLRPKLADWWCSSLSWTNVRSLGELRILNRLSLALLFVVPTLAGIWPLVRGTFSMYGRWHNNGNKMPDPFNLPVSWALLFFGAVCVVFGQLAYQYFAPELVRHQTRRDHILSRLSDWQDSLASSKWDFLRRAREYLRAIAQADPNRRHSNLVDRHRQLVWIPWRFDWFSAEELPLLDSAAQSQKTEQKPALTNNSDVRVSFPTLTPVDFISPEERFRIAVEEGAAAEYDLAAFTNSVAIRTSVVLYLLGVINIGIVTLIQIRNVFKQTDLPSHLSAIGIILMVFFVTIPVVRDFTSRSKP